MNIMFTLYQNMGNIFFMKYILECSTVLERRLASWHTRTKAIEKPAMMYSLKSLCRANINNSLGNNIYFIVTYEFHSGRFHYRKIPPWKVPPKVNSNASKNNFIWIRFCSILELNRSTYNNYCYLKLSEF